MKRFGGKIPFLLVPLLLVPAGCSKILAYPEVHPPDDGDTDAADGPEADGAETDIADGEPHDFQDTEDLKYADEDETELCEPGGTWILSFDTDMAASPGAAATGAPEGLIVAAASTMNGGIGGSDILVVKVDRCGAVLGAIAIGLTGDDAVSDIVRTGDGSFVVAGTTHYFIDSGTDTWIVKLDADLTSVEWQRALASSRDESIKAMTATADGRFAVVGASTYPDGDVNMYVALVASNGDPVWQETIGSAGVAEEAWGVDEFGDRILVAGRSLSSDDVSVAWILCLEKSDGTAHWMKTMDLDGYNAVFHDVAGTPAETILFTANVEGSGLFGELSADGGTPLYSKMFSTETPGMETLPLRLALIDAGTGIAIAGTGLDETNGLDEMFLATTTGVASPRGEWLALFGGELADHAGPRGLVETDDGLVLAGWSEASEDLWQLILVKMSDDGSVQAPCPLDGGRTSFSLWDETNYTNVADLDPGLAVIQVIDTAFDTTFASTRDLAGMEASMLCPAE